MIPVNRKTNVDKLAPQANAGACTYERGLGCGLERNVCAGVNTSAQEHKHERTWVRATPAFCNVCGAPRALPGGF